MLNIAIEMGFLCQIQKRHPQQPAILGPRCLGGTMGAVVHNANLASGVSTMAVFCVVTSSQFASDQESRTSVMRI